VPILSSIEDQQPRAIRAFDKATAGTHTDPVGAAGVGKNAQPPSRGHHELAAIAGVGPAHHSPKAARRPPQLAAKNKRFVVRNDP